MRAVMFMKLALITCGIFVLSSDLALALSCARPDPARIAEDYETVFVAFVTEGHFVEGEGPEDCGWIEGSFKIIEALKGNPDSVAIVRKRLINCNGAAVSGASDRFPIGKYILVQTNSEVAHLGLCNPAWDDYNSNCHVDAIQRHLSIDTTNIEVREWCISNESSGGAVSYAKALRKQITHLEKERTYIDAELEELKEELEKYGLSEEEL